MDIAKLLCIRTKSGIMLSKSIKKPRFLLKMSTFVLTVLLDSHLSQRNRNFMKWVSQKNQTELLFEDLIFAIFRWYIKSPEGE